ncbi:hypothetical protein, partial [Massilia timonae]|uniref:hypothetical protein n=1 Tax=Massilia timonae TaxID=47229 RepID=UPI00289C1339
SLGLILARTILMPDGTIVIIGIVLARDTVSISPRCPCLTVTIRRRPMGSWVSIGTRWPIQHVAE